MEKPIQFLHLEDDLRDAELAQAAIESAGISCEISLAQTAKEFSESLSRREYDIILADYGLPGYDGMSALRLVREHELEIPFIFISGTMGEDAAIHALTEGATDYVLKHKLSRLVPAVKRALQEAEIRRERKQAEEQIRYQARLLRHVNDAIIATDDQLRITTWNRGAEAMYGWSSKEVMGHNVAEILESALSEEQQAQAAERLKESTAFRSETIHRRKDGRSIYVETSTIALTNEQKQITGFVSVNRDITERKQATQEIESLAKFPQENVGPVLRFARDGSLLYANPASRSLLELWGCEIGERPPEEIQLIVYQTLMMHMRRELEVTHGDTIDALMFVPIVDKDYVNVYGRDITERKRAEEALRAAEAQYRTLVEQIPAITYITTLGEFSRAIYISPQIKTLGFTPEEWLTGLWVEQLHPDDRESVLAEVRQSQTKTAPFSLDYRVLNRDGQVRWFHDEAVIVHDVQGRPRFLQGVWLDVTERKMAQEALQDKERLLSEAQRIGHIGSWSYNIVNDTLQYSDEMYRLLDISPQEFPHNGEALLSLIYSSDQPMVAKWIENIRVHGQTREVEFRILRKNSELRYLRCTGAVEFDEAGTPARFIGTAQDVTERKLAEIQIRQQLEQLTALRKIDQAISSSFDLNVTLDILIAQLISQLQVDAADVLLLDPEGQVLTYTAGNGFRTSAVESARLRLADGQAVRERRLIQVENLTYKPDVRLLTTLGASEKFVCYFGVPLIVKGKVKGVLEAFHRAPLHPYAEWFDFLHTLAGQAAIAIENAQLFENLEQSNRELSQAYDATIEGWSRALDLRDKETEGHTQRVTELTLKLARAFGLPEEEFLHIRWGALLHDIGKMGVPDRILLKPGELTEEEWARMRSHPEYAYDLLKPIAFLGSALDIPYCHHEKWDGSGYPRGLKGQEIPLVARLFAVVDVWDALRSDRPYRKAWSVEKVREHIRDQAGIHFDPKVVERFLELIEE